MNTIKIIDDIFIDEPESVVTDLDIVSFLQTRYEAFPADGRIYFGEISETSDVTPYDANSVEALQNLRGVFYVVTLPRAPVVAFFITYGAYIAMAVAVIAAVVVMQQAKNVPNTAALGNQTNRSGNNELSERSNKARPWERIPDIYGEVISIPDLICQPYKIFDNHVEREFSLMCVGRGHYDIFDLSDIKDDTTPIQEIPGSSVEVFAPGNLTTPKYRVGEPITQNFYNLKRCNAVNGQVLKPVSRSGYDGQNGMKAEPGGWISVPENHYTPLQMFVRRRHNISFTRGLKVGDNIRLEFRSLDFTKVPLDNAVKITASNNEIMFYGKEAQLVKIKDMQAGSKFYCDGRYIAREENSKIFINYISGIFTVTKVEPVYGYVYNGVQSSSHGFVGYRVVTLEPVKIGDGGVRDAAQTQGLTVELSTATRDVTLTGRYRIAEIGVSRIRLENPSGVNADWNKVTSPVDSTGYCKITINNSDIVGPFICDYAQTTTVIANVVALSGLYKRDNDGDQPVNVEVLMTIDEIDMQGNLTGEFKEVRGTVIGERNWQGTRALTLTVALPPGRYKISMQRITPTDTGFKGSVVDEIKWRDLYYGSDLVLGDLGNITVVKSITNGTDGALAVKSRKLNMRVTRMLPKRIGAAEFSTTLHPTKEADDIFCAICLDKANGGRTVDEVDVAGIYDTMTTIRRYFGIPEAAHFCYTFDNPNTSFEEMIRMVADAVFCTAYRTGEKIRITPDIDNKLPVMIFNHRNKIPGSETRTVNFGKDGDYDGVQYKYIDPFDGKQIMYSVPEGAAKYKSMESAGVANHKQAYLHAWRIWNRMKYQRVSCKFTSLSEADLLVVMDKIAVSDNTRLQYSEGEVIKQDGLKVWLSGQPDAKVGNYIFFQHWNRTTQSIKIAKVEGSVVTLATAPSVPLAADDGNYVNSLYMIEKSDKLPPTKQFLLMEKKPERNMQVEVSCINYDSRYYSNDFDYANGNTPYNG